MEKSPAGEKGNRVGRIYLISGILAGLLFWPLDALIDVIFFYDRHFVEELLSPPEVETYLRLLVASLFISVGMIGRYAAREKQAIQSLLISEERWQFALEGSGDGVWDWNIRDGTIFLSRRCKVILGYAEDELGNQSKDWESLVHPDDIRRVKRELIEYARNEIPIYLTEYRARCRDGSYKWLLSRGKVSTRDDKGGAVRMVGTHSDITERRQARERLAEALDGSIHAIGKAIEARDPYTSGHMRRVAKLSAAIAREMGLTQQQIEGIYMGANIHDIGKIQVPAEILSKPSKISETEYLLIQSHAQVGYDILKDIRFPWPIADIAYQHHERLDGSGYPQGLKGDEICLEARIVAVADIVEAMSSHRPYRPSLGINKAMAEIESGRGKTLDSHAVDACLKLFKEHRFDIENWQTSLLGGQAGSSIAIRAC